MTCKRIAALFCFLSFSCSLFAQVKTNYGLRGTIVEADGKVVDDGVLEVRGEVIAAIRSSAGDSDIATQSYILPGFIDLHDHITWNIFPRWRSYLLYPNRYEWQQRADYKMALDTPHGLFVKSHEDECYANEYAEIKAMVGGATATVGSLGAGDRRCIEGLVRNLDFDSEITGRKVNNEVFPFGLSVERANEIRNDLGKTPPIPFLAHVAEGKASDAASQREFISFMQAGFLRAGASIIHGVSLRQPEFAKMAAAGVGLIWSPRSNIELYGETADVASAKAAGASGQRLTIALAPDWSPSGSDGVLQELKYAAVWNAGQRPAVFSNQELLGMVTATPAKLAGISDKVGTLAPNMLADLVLIRRGASSQSAFDSIVESGPADIRLVVIGGVPLYGDSDLMAKLHSGETLETLNICGVQKSLFLRTSRNGSGYPHSWKEVSERLMQRLNQLGTTMAPLTACEGTNLN
jgi:cytosine/adenosine deaminase-related metal-dependent hydrolase